MKVMTFNIAQGVGMDNVEDLTRVAELIRDSGAEVVALQEVAVDEHGDQGVRLAARLGMEIAEGYKLGRWHCGHGHPSRPYGMAVLSRHPIEAVAHHLLPPSPDDYRELLEARILGIRFLAAHPTAEGEAERAAQLAAIHRITGSAGGPAVLLGDLNDAHAGPPGAAYADPGPTWPADAPAERLDHVYGLGGVAVKEARVMTALASDHLPVVATLAL
ncbi:endonuclease/exonuclease/phosphatase family protein [Nonomuraea sp. NBC_01738]|uniref:endonuclease/exonuclease/phosphatase family protein n=1 Tax=Nonomuraea sp. NBC_01738 TaxID=2976003 RepID=UPI002E11CD52|nr:endonuclease/exonuclease/phosphatase family protein [Nonomuraea sp. NBC_01738]